MTDPDTAPASATEIKFDLSDVLTPEEVEKFQAAAKAADAPNLTEHFLDLTLRHERAA
jgi:hypothetical protein